MINGAFKYREGYRVQVTREKEVSSNPVDSTRCHSMSRVLLIIMDIAHTDITTGLNVAVSALILC